MICLKAKVHKRDGNWEYFVGNFWGISRDWITAVAIIEQIQHQVIMQAIKDQPRDGLGNPWIH